MSSESHKPKLTEEEQKELNDQLWSASNNGENEKVKRLLDQGADINYDNGGLTVLGVAASRGHTDIVRLLISKQELDINKKDSWGGRNAFLWSCEGGHIDCASLIFNAGIDPQATDEYGMDAVLTASLSGNLQLVDFLSNQGLSLSSVNKDSQNVMHMACLPNRIDMIKYLMTKGFKLDSPQDKDGETPRMKLRTTRKDVKQFLEELKSQDNTENPTVFTESTDTNTEVMESTDKDSQQDTHLVYAPYLEKAAAKGTVITRQSSLGLCGAAGTGKSSTLRLITGQPPLEQHNSTPVLKPEEYYNSDDRVVEDEGGDECPDSDEELGLPAQSTAKQHQPVAPVKQELLISNEASIWKLATEKEIMEQLANWTLAAIEQEKMVYKGKEYNMVVALTRPDQGNQDSTPNDDPIEEVSDGATPKGLPKQTSVESACNELTESILKFIESVKTLNKPVGITHFISTCDTGGQAAFIDIAPAFLRYNSVILILLKLDENLDDPAQFFYSVNGVRIGDEERQISTRSLVQSFVSSKSKIHKPNIIKGMKVVRQSQKPKFMILGTHFDKYKEKLGKCQSKEAKNEILSQDLEAFNDCLHTKNRTKLMFTLNTLARDKNSNWLASEIRKLVKENYIEAEIPISWYIFQLAMYRFKSSKANQGMIHLSSLIEIGTVTKMPQEEVEACLLYFHDLQVCLYFPSVVPNIVFTNPQFLFDKISELIAFTFSTSTNIRINKKELQKFTNLGVFTESFLKYVCSGFKDDFFSAKDFLSLMSHLFVVCSLPNTDEYFMPCVLATHPNPCEDLGMCSGKPLALTWDKSVPNGLFPSLTTKIQARNGINNLQFTMSSNSKQYRNKITLTCINLACSVSLIECTSFIIVFVSGHNSAIPEIPHRHVKIRGAVFSCVKDIVQRLGWLPSLADPMEVFLCDICPPCASSIHMCYCDDTRRVLYCDIANKSTMITESHSIWWTSSHDSSIQESHQTLSQDELLDMNRDCNNVVTALNSIYHKWYQLGTHLNIPISTLESISTTHNNDHFRQTSDLISTWIRRPTLDHHPCLRVLCQSLSAMGEVALAEKIAKDHHHKDHHHI